MHHSRRALSAVLATLVLLSGATPLIPGAATASPRVAARTTTVTPQVERLAGEDRLETAVDVSRHGWDSADTVVIATARNFPDALVGGPLAAAYDAPILLAEADGLSAETRAEISRLGATRAFIVGGTRAIPGVVESQLEAAGFSPGDIWRLEGPTRYETAVAVARHLASLQGTPARVVIATGEAFPDALSVSGLAGSADMPILLVKPEEMPVVAAGFLDDFGIESVLVVGGIAAVADSVVAGIEDAERVGGIDRYETAAFIAEYAFQHGFTYDEVFVAVGTNFPDALVAGSLCARRASPIVLVRSTSLTDKTERFLNAHCSAITQLVFLGGTAAIEAKVVSAAVKAATEVVNADAQELASDTASKLSTMTADGDMVFAGSTTQLDDLAIGAVVVVEPDTQFPDGLFRKVTGVSESGGQTIVQTAQAALSDVLIKGSVDVTGTAEELPAIAPPAVEVSAGWSHSLAILADGSLWAWGANEAGQLGIGEAGTTINKPVRVGTDTDWLSISAGAGYSLAIKQDGSLWTWGSNAGGQAGLGDSIAMVAEPTQLSDAKWKQAVAYSTFAAAIRDDGTLWMWGFNYWGQLGDGTRDNHSTPEQVGSDADWASVDIGRSHTVALKEDGSLWTWGRNQYGQLGEGPTSALPLVPTRVGTGTWDAVSAGHYHTLGIASDGTLWGWGHNTSGCVGDGTFVDKTVPTEISSDTDWNTVETDGYVSFAVKDDWSRWAWGDDTKLGLALETPGTRNVPTQGPEDHPWIALDASGAGGIAALDMRGQIETAGDNSWGQLGDGSIGTPRGEFAVVEYDQASVDTLGSLSVLGTGGAEADLAAASGDTGKMAPAERIGSWWQGFDLRYYPGLNDWTFASWADRNPGVYYGPYVAFSGHMSISASFYLNAYFDSSGLVDCGVYFAMDEGLSLFVDTTRNGGQYTGSITMWPIPDMSLGRVYFSAGGLPAFVDINLQVLCGVEGSVKAPAMHFRQFGDRTIGLTWNRHAGFNQVNYGSNDNYCYPPGPNTTMSAKAWTSARFSTLFYGVAGPYVKFTGFGEVDANTSWNPWWKLELGLDGSVGGRLKFFDYIDEEYGVTQPLIRWTVARAPGPYPN